MKQPLLSSSFLVWLGMIVLAPLWGTAQGDSVLAANTDKKGTIRVQRPPVIPKVRVIATYSVNSGSDGPSSIKNKRTSKTNADAFIGDSQNKRSTGVDYPAPKTVDYTIFSDSAEVVTIEKEIPGRDVLAEIEIREFEYSYFFEKNLGYTYAYLETPKSDTVTLGISVSKSGKHTYYYTGKHKGKALIEQKCFEVLSHIKTWDPAYIKYYNGRGTKLRRKKKAQCNIYLTVIITAQPPTDSFEQLWEEAGK